MYIIESPVHIIILVFYEFYFLLSDSNKIQIIYNHHLLFTLYDGKAILNFPNILPNDYFFFSNNL